MTLQQYLVTRPDLANNWANAHAAGANASDPTVSYINSFPNFDAYVTSDFQYNNPGATLDAPAAPVVTAPPATPAPVTAPATTTSPGSALSSLVGSVGTGAAALNGVGGNSSQVQGGAQTGTLNTNTATTGGTAGSSSSVNTNQSSGASTNTTTGSNTGATTNAGTTSGMSSQQFAQLLSALTQTQGGQTQQGASATTNTPIDTVGFTNALQQLLGGAVQADQARGAFLGDVMQTGGSGFNSQVDKAVRQSLSGPGMTGTGESAAARAAGYAAADVARNNLGQRLQAAGQLAGPSTTGTMAQQGQGLLGQSSSTNYGSAATNQSTTGTTQNTSGTSSGVNSGTNTNTGTTTGNNTQTATGAQANNSVSSSLGNTLNSMAQNTGTSSAATGNSVAAAAGNTPTQTTSGGGGGCYLTTVLGFPAEDIRAAVEYKLQKVKSKWMPIGYSIYGPPLARLVLKHKFLERLLRPISLSILNEELRLAGERKGLRLVGWALHFIFHNGSALLGWSANKLTGRRCETRDLEMVAFLKSKNLYFEV